jgi:hypothetical protein
MNIQDQNNELLRVFKTYPVLYEWMIQFHPFELSTIEKYSTRVDWELLSSNKSIPWSLEFIKKYDEKFDWEYRMWANPNLPWSAEFISMNIKEHYGNAELCNNRGVPWSIEIFECLPERMINKSWLAYENPVTWTYEMFDYLNMWDQDLSSIRTDFMDANFLLEHKDKLNWGKLCSNPYLPWTEVLLEGLKPTFKKIEKSNAFHFYSTPYSSLSSNPALPWSLDFIKNNVKKPLRRYGFNWKDISVNKGIPWQEGILKEFHRKLDWTKFSRNNGACFTSDDLYQYTDYISWGPGDESFANESIFLNTSVKWTDKIIDDHINKVDWFSVSINPTMPWSETFIDKHKDNLSILGLKGNIGLPWSLNFILKYEQEILQEMKYVDSEKAEVIWQKVFGNVMNKEMIERIFELTQDDKSF